MNDILQALYECNIDENILDQCDARAERLKKERYFPELEKKNLRSQETIAEQTPA